MRTIQASVVGKIAQLAGEHGVDRDGLIRALGLPGEQLAVREAVPLELSDATWVLATRLGPPDIGLRVAASVERSSFGLLTYLLAASATVHDALRRLERSYPVLSGGTRYPVRTCGEGLIVGVELSGPRPAVVEAFAVGVVVAFLRRHADWRPARVELRQRAPAAALMPAYLDVFGADIRFGAPRAQIQSDARACARPLHDADPGLAAVLDDQVRMQLAQTQPVPAAWGERVRAALVGGAASGAEIAAQLGVHERTLRRHLQREGVALSDLLEARRREHALELLTSTDAPLSELAHRVGYAESASFARAFRRWYGLSPRAFTKAAAMARSP